MLDVVILAVGKVKSQECRRMIDEYLKRLSVFARVKEIETKTVSFGAHDREKAKRSEGEELASALAKFSGAAIVYLEEKGEMHDSFEFAESLSRSGRKTVLVIGGSQGIDPELKKKFAGKTVSLSPLTMCHELARLVLAEQLYRAVTILNKKEYHY